MKSSAERKITKKHLKTLTKNGHKKLLRNTTRVVKYGTINFGRNIWLSTAASLIMTLTLIILAVTLVASVVLNETAEAMKNKIDITLFFAPETEPSALARMKQKISADPNVKSVEVRTSEQEYENFLIENSDNALLIETLEDPEMNMRETMIATMQSTMRLKVYDTENLDSIKSLVASDIDFVKNLDKNEEPTYDVNKNEIATITRWANIARTGGVVLSGIFIVISILVIFNTIRMAIFSRREEIYMMKLVGADKSFIRGPFLVEAEICGIIAGLIAATASYFMFKFLAPRLTSYGIDVSQITEILDSNKLIIVFLIFIAMGIIIGRISARLAVARYLSGKQK